MRLKIIFIFLLTILIPTFLLSYFGLLAVRSEKSIVEKNLLQKYKATADIVAREIETALINIPSEKIGNITNLEKVLIDQASLFKNEVSIFDRQKNNITKNLDKKLNEALYVKSINNLPYVIAVYEGYPLNSQLIENKRQKIYLYICVIFFSAFIILLGGGFTLRALSNEWRFAKLKSEFVSHLSHDLRRPLTSIKMFSEMLKDGNIPNEESRSLYYKIISDESEKLTHLANNILDFSRIEKGRVKYNFQEGDIVKTVENAVDRFKRYMIENTREVILNVDKDIPKVKFDENAIFQSIINLFSNADKYSSKDKKIQINLFKKKNEIIIEIIDEGIGIPKSEQKKIFNKYYRVFSKNESQPEGSGLGLALVSYTAKAHKGKIKVESAKGKGTKFSLILPV